MPQHRFPWLDDTLPRLLDTALLLWPTLDKHGVTVIRGTAVLGPLRDFPLLGVRMAYDPATRTLNVMEMPK